MGKRRLACRHVMHMGHVHFPLEAYALPLLLGLYRDSTRGLLCFEG